MTPHRYPMAPLIRFTLISLYLALVLPLPLLAPAELQPLLWAALPLGLAVILALVSEQVELSESGIRVGHPAWCHWLLRRGWQLNWDQISGLTPWPPARAGASFTCARQTARPTCSPSGCKPLRISGAASANTAA